MQAYDSADVLGEYGSAGQRHGQKQRVERSVVKAFTDELPRRHDDPRLGCRQFVDLPDDRGAISCGHFGCQDEGANGELLEHAAQFFDMLLTVGEDKNPPPASDKLAADPENELVAFGVTGKPVHQFGVNEPRTEGFGMLKAADVEPDGQVVRLLELPDDRAAEK